MKAQVMASKGILVSDPSLADMTPVRWAFEYAGIISNREHTWRTTVKTAKDMAIHLLGLDAVPPKEDIETQQFEASKIPYLPLSAFINPELFSSTMRKISQLEAQKEALAEHPSTVAQMGYDEMVASFEDLIPVFDEIFDGAEIKVDDARVESAKKAGVLLDESAVKNPSQSLPPSPRDKFRKRVKLNG